MFVWSSSASPVSEGAGLPVFATSEQSGRSDPGAKEIRLLVGDNGEAKEGGGEGGRENIDEEKEKEVEVVEVEAEGNVGKHMPPASVMTRLILIMVWRKLIRNPNTYSSLIGLIWSLVSFRYHQTISHLLFLF